MKVPVPLILVDLNQLVLIAIIVMVVILCFFVHYPSSLNTWSRSILNR